jgi:hypothetical protein
MHACAKRPGVSSLSFKLNARDRLKPMENPMADLSAALRERLTIIRDETSRRNPETHMARLKKISERIEALRFQLPKPVHPQLAHFLERNSYDKALEFLEKL